MRSCLGTPSGIQQIMQDSDTTIQSQRFVTRNLVSAARGKKTVCEHYKAAARRKLNSE